MAWKLRKMVKLQQFLTNTRSVLKAQECLGQEGSDYDKINLFLFFTVLSLEYNDDFNVATDKSQTQNAQKLNYMQ